MFVFYWQKVYFNHEHNVAILLRERYVYYSQNDVILRRGVA